MSDIYRKGEGYRDTTAGKAIKRAARTPDRIMDAINLMQHWACVAGVDVVGIHVLNDRTTGKEWR